jgi:hypothetical protein
VLGEHVRSVLPVLGIRAALLDPLDLTGLMRLACFLGRCCQRLRVWAISPLVLLLWWLWSWRTVPV